MDFHQQEESNYPKAFIATGIVVGLFVILCLIRIFTELPPPEMGTGGILVNYGTSDQGMGTDYMSTEEPSKAEKPNHVKTTKVTQAQPTPQKTHEEVSPKKVVTQNTEDAPEVNDKAKVTTKTAATTTPTPPKPAKPTLNQNALYKGKSNGGTGEGDGTTNTPGNQGKPTGSTLANNYDGTGSGNGGNLKMDQRSFVIPPKRPDGSNRYNGKIVVEIHVDRQGKVISATAGAKGTTISDNGLFEKCQTAALNSKLNALESAQETQIGFVTFVFKVQ